MEGDLIRWRGGARQDELTGRSPPVGLVSDSIPKIRSQLPFINKPRNLARQHDTGARLCQRRKFRRTIQGDGAGGDVDGRCGFSNSLGALDDNCPKSLNRIFDGDIGESFLVFLHASSLANRQRLCQLRDLYLFLCETQSLRFAFFSHAVYPLPPPRRRWIPDDPK